MTTLADIALVVAKQLGRANVAGTAILDLETEIKAEITNAVKQYNRKPMHLTEFRGGTLTTAAGVDWYSTVDLTAGDGDQDNTGRSAVDVNDIIKLHYVRENPGGSGLNERMTPISYEHFERLNEGSTPQGQPEFYTLYAGQIGIWPTPSGVSTLYWSGIVKPVIPTADSDESVWFDQANELIEAATARRVNANYIRDTERMTIYAASEASALRDLENEYVRKTSTGRLKAHD